MFPVSPLLLNDNPAETLNAMYAPLLQSLLDGGPTSVPNVMAGLPETSVHAQGRDPATEEKIRLLLISSLMFWMLVSQNGAVKQRLANTIGVLSDPAKWATVAELFFGPA